MTETHRDENGTNLETKNGRLDSSLDGKPDIESLEIDPCLDQVDSKKVNLPFYDQYLSSFQARSGLPTRQWVFIVLGLVVLAIVLFLVVLGMAIGWPKVPHMFKYPICRDQTCLKAASQIQQNLDSSVSPCSDLWSAVCSKYAKNSSSRPLDRPVWNQKEALNDIENERLRDVIATFDPPLNTGSVQWKMKTLYEACLDMDTISIDDARPLENIIAELGGWYILRQWGGVAFDGMQLLTKLQARFGVTPYFKIHVEPNPHDPDTHSIRISPSGLGLPDKEYYDRDSEDKVLAAYRDYIRDIVISLSSTRNDAAKFSKDMFHYEKRIAEITPDLPSLQNPITTYNSITLAELKLTTNTIPFFDIIQAMYPSVPITENTEVIVTSLEYLNQLAQIISSTERKTMNGYLIWSLVREYIPFLSEKFTDSMESFDNALLGTSKSQKRWKLCSGLVRKYMVLASEYHLEKTFPVAQSTRDILNETFVSLLSVLKKKVSRFYETPLLRQHLEIKLNALTFHTGLPDASKDPHFLEDYYSTLTIIKLNLFEGIKSAKKFEKKLEELWLSGNSRDSELLQQLLLEPPEIRYVPSRNAVVVPRSLAMEPFFENGYPSPVLYGRLGVEMASAILASVLPYGSLWSADRKILSPFHMTVNDSVKSVQSSVECLSRYILDQNFGVSPARTSETSLTVLRQLSAVKLAYEALLMTSATHDHKHYGGLEQFEDSALYFLTFAQTQCSSSTPEFDTFKNLLDFKLPPNRLLQLAWRQLPDFPKAFDCASSEDQCLRLLLV